MPTVALTAADFEPAVRGAAIVIVDFSAQWCGPCRRFAPVFAASAELNPDVLHATVDTDAEQDLAAAARIASVPTVMAFREGELVFHHPGAMSGSALAEVLDEIRDLDMAEVRAQAAERRARRAATAQGASARP